MYCDKLVDFAVIVINLFEKKTHLYAIKIIFIGNTRTIN